MISYNLTCDYGHSFEGWFSSSADYDNQQARGLVSCPYCHSGSVKKALMAPNVTAKSNQKTSQGKAGSNSAEKEDVPPQHNDQQQMMTQIPSEAPKMPPEIQHEMQEKMGEMLSEMRKFQKVVETHCDDVGDGFAV